MLIQTYRFVSWVNILEESRSQVMTANVIISVQKLDESESGQMVFQKVKVVKWCLKK